MTTKEEKVPSNGKKGPLRVGKCPPPPKYNYFPEWDERLLLPPPLPAGAHGQM